jgi:transcriptional regulator with XRE-family HTH domain
MVESPTQIGQAIKSARIAAGLNQRELAEKADLSPSLVGKIECGNRAVTHSSLAAVARALRKPVEFFTGQPYVSEEDQRTYDNITDLRRALRRHDLPPDQRPRALPELEREVRKILSLRTAARYGALSARLPGVLEDLAVAAGHADATTATAVQRLLADTYLAAHTLAYRLGYADLAEAIEVRLASAAARTGDPFASGLDQWVRAQAFQSAGDYTAGLRLMTTALDDLNGHSHAGDPAAITITGSLHLRAVTLASRAGDKDTANSHLDAAHALATRLGGADQVHHGLTFGTANTTTHAVAAHVELGDSAAALNIAKTWAPPAGMPRSRRGHHHLDLARAYLHHGRPTAALRELQRARDAAPQQTRLHPMVRDTMNVLISKHRRSSTELAAYAGWLGIAS